MKIISVFVIIFLLCAIPIYFFEVSWWTIVWLSLLMVLFAFTLIKNILKWTKNKKYIECTYIRLKNKSNVLEISAILTNILSLKNQYINRETYLAIVENKHVEINNFIDFLNSYEGIDKIANYMPIIIIVFFLLSLILNMVLKQIASKEGILFNDGSFIKSYEIDKIKVEESFFGFSKKITIYAGKSSNTVYLIKDKFTEFKEMVTLFYKAEIEEVSLI